MKGIVLAEESRIRLFSITKGNEKIKYLLLCFSWMFQMIIMFGWNNTESESEQKVPKSVNRQRKVYK